MIVCVLNFSGNVGKTTVAGHMIQPRMDSAQLFSVESLNSDGTADGLEIEKIKAKRFGDLIEEIMEHDDAVIDVGASNAEEFLKLMTQYDGSHEEFDYFVIPTVKEKKQQADTVNTIRALANIGVPRKKIRLVFNRVEVDDEPEVDFSGLFALAELEKSFILQPDAVIYQSELFEKLKSVGKSLSDIASDENDYREMMRQPGISQDEKDHYKRMVQLKRLGKNATANLDQVFKTVFGK